MGFQTEYFPPDTTANATIFGLLASLLGAAAIRVNVVTAEPHRSEAPIGQGTPQVPEQVQVARVKGPSWQLHGRLARRFVSELAFVARNTFLALRSSRRWDVVLASTPPLLLGVGAAAVARVRRIPLVWWVQDLHPEIGAFLGLTTERSVGYRILHWAHSWVLHRATTIVTISECQRDTLLGAYPHVCAAKVAVLENPAAHSLSSDDYDRQDVSEITLVAYTGNFGLSQGLEHVLAVADVSRSLPVQFILHGDGAAKPSLLREISRRRLANVRFSDFRSNEDYVELLAKAHVLLLVLRPGIDRFSFPSKLWTYFAAGRPVLAWAGEGGAVEDTIRRSEAGIFAPWGEVSECVESLRPILDRERRLALASSAKRFYSSHASPREHADRLSKILLDATRADAP